jgi:hypothetical protein
LHTTVRIVSEEGSKPWAKTTYPRTPSPPFFVEIIFDNKDAGHGVYDGVRNDIILAICEIF